MVWLMACIFAIGAVSAYWCGSYKGTFATYRWTPYQVDFVSASGIMGVSCGKLVSQYPAPEWFSGQILPFVGDGFHYASGLGPGTWFGFYFGYSNDQRANLIRQGIEIRVPYWFLFATLLTTTAVTNRWLLKRSRQGFPVVVKAGEREPGT